MRWKVALTPLDYALPGLWDLGSSEGMSSDRKWLSEVTDSVPAQSGRRPGQNRGLVAESMTNHDYTWARGPPTLKPHLYFNLGVVRINCQSRFKKCPTPCKRNHSSALDLDGIARSV